PGVTIATINDCRRFVDTPHDTVDRLEPFNLEEQTRILGAVIGRIVNSTKPYTEARVTVPPWIRSFRGEITEFRFGKSVLADFPVPDVIVSAFSGQGAVVKDPERYKTMAGVRTHLVAITDQRGRYIYPQIMFRTLYLEPLRYDNDSGRIAYAADRGNQGELHYALNFSLDQAQKKWRNVVFRAEALDIYGADDPRYLRNLNQTFVLGPLDFAPERYGYCWMSGRAHTVYFEPGNRVKVIMGSGVFGKQYLLTNAVSAEEARLTGDTEGKPKPTGIGYSDRDEQGRRQGALTHTPERVVHDTLILNQSRMDKLRAHGIENKLLAGLQARARRQYRDAVEDRKDELHGSSEVSLLAARGLAARAYPDVMGTATDTIKGLVFYFALLLPFSVFCERLFFASPDIRKRILGVCGVFVLVFFIMYLAHPAFRICQNPWIIFVAFVLMAMSVFVICIVINKFNEQIAQLRRATSAVHETDVGRLSASVAAFNLGINNMRKRKVRTLLTTATLILLMFTVLSFTSVETYTSFNEIPVTGAKPRYAGALIRDRNWNAMEDIAWRYCSSAFQGSMQAIAPRAWYVSTEKESELHLRVERADGAASTYARAAIGLTPQERLATGLQEALLEGHAWLAPDSGAVCVLPLGMARRLGIDPKDVKTGASAARNPAVRVFGRLLTVSAILDTRRLPENLDLDGGNISPVDTTDVASRGAFGEEETVASVRENPTELGSFKHMPLENVIII
ncbi:MAG TPA: hypothetical protein P5137_16145, partial [Candidatus Brocadiia bacterium]|nr:hypothetical protein [Candidatus Brocadiia bacterium]